MHRTPACWPCYSHSAAGCCCLSRPANKDCALDGSLMIGVPAGVFSLPGKSLSYYLVMLKPKGTPLTSSRLLPFEGLRLGQQLGRGESCIYLCETLSGRESASLSAGLHKAC